jgi:hypothetical protein
MQGDIGSEFYIIFSGNVEIRVNNHNVAAFKVLRVHVCLRQQQAAVDNVHWAHQATGKRARQECAQCAKQQTHCGLAPHAAQPFLAAFVHRNCCALAAATRSIAPNDVRSIATHGAATRAQRTIAHCCDAATGG